MITIKPFIPTLRTLVPALTLLLALTACGDADKGGKKADKKDTQAKADGDKTKARDTAGAPDVDTPEAEMPKLDPKVEKAVSLANKLVAEPGRADAILEEAGMDRASFQVMLYEIAEDPELSKSYVIAREA